MFRVSCGYKNNGKQIIKSKTWKPEKGMTEKQAEKEAQRQAVLFEDNIKRNDLTGKRLKFQDLSEEWITVQEKNHNMKPSTIVRIKTLRERTYNAIGKTYVDKITYRQIQNFILSLAEDGVNQRTGKGLSQKTQKHYITFISDVMQYARKCGIISINPCTDVETVRTPKKEKDIYSIDEVRAILDRINKAAPLKYKIMFAIFAYCGLRRGEVMGLEFKDFNFDKGTARIERTSLYQSGVGVYTTTPKTESSRRTIKLPQYVITLVKQLRAEYAENALKCGDQWNETDRLFIQWNGEPMNPNSPSTWLQRFCEKENLSFKGLHSFRHTFITTTIIGGQILKAVSVSVGHSDTKTLHYYTHSMQECNNEVFDFMANRIATA